MEATVHKTDILNQLHSHPNNVSDQLFCCITVLTTVACQK